MALHNGGYIVRRMIRKVIIIFKDGMALQKEGW